MRIEKILSQHRRDFTAIYKCEHCGHEDRRPGYDDTYFHSNVVPSMCCPTCGFSAADDFVALEPKYPEGIPSMNESALKVIAELYPKYGVEFWRYVQFDTSKGWCDCIEKDEFDPCDGCEYRVKPNTHVVNGIECPSPLSEMPEEGFRYWYIDTNSSQGYDFSHWDDVFIDHVRAKVGIWATDEEAKTNRDAHYPGVFN